jgi:adenylosuccinate synthase
MTKQIKIVIGAGFGDEGKGLMTDYFASKASGKPIVIRFNGGAQAAHTVVTPQGVRHVFSHFGAGTLAGAPTYLSQYFICNPLHFRREHEELVLLMKDRMPYLLVDRECIVTTPWDMMINQIMETLRGGARHGSCGYGIEETVRRSEDYDGKYALYVKDLYDEGVLRDKLALIQNEYVPLRLSDLGVNEIPSPFSEVLFKPGIMQAYLLDCENFTNEIFVEGDPITFISQFDTAIFEGAQGLLLDQNAECYYPHVTSSNTGLQNVQKILNQMNRGADVEVVYATRCYATRHGAGNFSTETTKKPYPRIEDPTNIPNEWQGSLRFGWLNIDEFKRAIKDDTEAFGREDMRYSIAVTCLDQADGRIGYVEDGEYFEGSEDTLLAAVSGALPKMTTCYRSHGPTRQTITKAQL